MFEYSRKMALQSITKSNSYSFILHFLVFVLPHVFVIVFVFPVFIMTSMHFPKLRHCPTQNLYLVKLNISERISGGCPFPVCISDLPIYWSYLYSLKKKNMMHTQYDKVVVNLKHLCFFL